MAAGSFPSRGTASCSEQTRDPVHYVLQSMDVLTSEARALMWQGDGGLGQVVKGTGVGETGWKMRPS